MYFDEFQGTKTENLASLYIEAPGIFAVSSVQAAFTVTSLKMNFASFLILAGIPHFFWKANQSF